MATIAVSLVIRHERIAHEAPLESDDTVLLGTHYDLPSSGNLLDDNTVNLEAFVNLSFMQLWEPAQSHIGALTACFRKLGSDMYPFVRDVIQHIIHPFDENVQDQMI